MNFQDIFERTLRPLVPELAGKVVVDVPAGEGRTTAWLQRLGAKPIPLDLFPRFFKHPNLTCQECDLNESLPVADGVADFIISQEGIEHVANQVQLFSEFSRALKTGGRLILTAPNGSSLNSKISSLLNESERYARIMPANLVDSVWYNDAEAGAVGSMAKNATGKIYFGHIFIPQATKLRVMAGVSGLELESVYFSELKISNLFWFILLYPFIVLANVSNYFRNLRKRPHAKDEYRAALKLALDPRILLDGSLILSFRKVCSGPEAKEKLFQQYSRLQKNTP